ncbi:sensor histidine kinase [Aquincola sp. S2]|uniref:Sensor histidine kinase n=1 Tax=Pseudaquabacterium terrae TaxID=2732868 RepID=A0ABX2EC03_9BURK|nr:ATP-binding protein [Aquabacterium terrae]NRF66136.1 sensor histidine kinase [Aquabacterium terrae]
MSSPPPSTRARAAARLLGWVLAIGMLGAWLPARAHTLVFRHAQTLELTPAKTPDWSAARSIALPDDWAVSRPGYSGLAAYRLAFDADSAVGSGALYALYVERACSVLEVHINGQLAYRGGRMTEPVSRNCLRPQLVPLPAALLQAQGNVLELRVRGFALEEVGSRQRAGGVSMVELGPHDALASRHRWRTAFAIRLPEVVSGTLVLMGFGLFVMGWLNRRQSYLAYFGALMVGWALALSRLWLTDLPWPHATSELLLAALMSLTTLAAVQFLMRYAARRMRWLDFGLPLQSLLMVASLIAAGPQRLYPVATVWFAVLSLEIGVAAAFYLLDTHRRRHRQLWLMGPLLGVVGVALATEFMAQQTRLDVRIGYVAQLVPSLIFMAMGLRLVQQYGRALESAEQGRAELEVRIREATAQIERNFAQLAELKVEQVTDRERKRIAADLHDDLGAKLLTIVHTSDNERISTLAREALEEMRLSVRGLTGKPVKLADALGDWRAEVVSRLTQSGVEGEWSAPSDDDVPGTLSARAYVQTTRILREAVSNIIKHSGASHCAVRCAIAEGDFQLVIQDNGNGIPLELDGRLDKGHGMASMKGRAKQLQGQCLVESGPGYGTVIRLTLPLDRHVTAT